MVGARSFPGNLYDGHTLAEQLEQTNTLLQDIGVKPTTAVVDLGFNGVDEACASVQIIHRGKFKPLVAATQMAEAAPGDRAGHRAHRERQPDGPLLAQRQQRWRATCSAVRGEVQHPLAAEGHCHQGTGGPSFGLLAAGLVCRVHRQRAADSDTRHWANRSPTSVPTRTGHTKFDHRVTMDFSEPTKTIPAGVLNSESTQKYRFEFEGRGQDMARAALRTHCTLLKPLRRRASRSVLGVACDSENSLCDRQRSGRQRDVARWPVR